ncbi:polymorphic toxin type 30 domain-containing protein [Listeria seeligeri]|uniref:polymorphic toxin type 30 domain-containing protein n=1 Tax=Listeria seeligeri TaxID=1640 RepID=UPI0022EC1233|nr:polymorphic toxin type 30 domain-containing protein [Listeria seeligeri]
MPKDAKKRLLTPQSGKVIEGFEYTWKTDDGTKMTVRVHGPDASAPEGSNAAKGWIVRVKKGKKYLDSISGEFQPPGISRPDSEFYNEELINSTHIPIQTQKNR